MTDRLDLRTEMHNEVAAEFRRTRARDDKPAVFNLVEACARAAERHFNRRDVIQERTLDGSRIVPVEAGHAE